MNIRKKEGEGTSISIQVDKGNYKNLINDLKKLGKRYEHESNSDKLNYSLLANFQRLPYMKVKGWCSRCVSKTGKITEVFFADYDNVLFRIVESEMKYLMEEHDMPPAYVFKTFEDKDPNGEIYGNYIIVILKKNTFREVVNIQNELHCDAAYKRIPLIYRFRTWVLRLSGKGKKKPPQFKCIIGDLEKTYSQDVSQGHLEAIKSIYPGIPDVKYSNLDGCSIKDLFFTEYTTASP